MPTRMAGPSGSTSRLTMAWMLPHIQRRRCLKYAPQVHGRGQLDVLVEPAPAQPWWAALQPKVRSSDAKIRKFQPTWFSVLAGDGESLAVARRAAH